MKIGQAIREMRLQKSLRQKDLAAILHVSDKTVSSWESNRTEPNMETIDALCKVFECSKSDFWDSATDYVITLSEKEKILIENYRHADVYDKTAVERILKYYERIKDGKS